MLKQININSKVRIISTTKFYEKSREKDTDLDIADLNTNVMDTAIGNIDKGGIKEDLCDSTIIMYLLKLLEKGYSRDLALKETADTFGIDKKTMLEAMQQELLKRKQVKKTKKGEFILCDR